MIFMNGLLNNKDKLTVRYAHRNEQEWEDAMGLAWRVFLKFEADEYGREGTDNFLDFIAGQQLFEMFLNGDYVVALAFVGKELTGVGTMRAGSHISLLFVDERYHREGIGTRLLEFLQEGTSDNRITVNSSPYGVEFYKSLGFVPTADKMQEADGITFLPMVCTDRIIVKK